MHGLTVEKFSELVGLAYAAGYDPSRWPAFISALDAHVDGAYLSVYGHDMRSGVSLGTLTSRYTDEMQADYAAHYADTNIFLPALMNALVMDIRYSESWVFRETLLASELYNDFLSRHEDIGSGGGGFLFNDDDRLLIVSGQIRFRDEDEKTPRLIETLRLLAPHLRRAFELQRGLQGRAMTVGMYRQSLDQVRNSVFLLNSRKEVVFQNRAANAALARYEALWCDRTGRLVFADNTANRLMGHAIDHALQPENGTPSVQFALALDEHTRVAASFDPFHVDLPDRDPIPVAIVPDLPVVMLVILDAEIDPRQARERLRALYNLTTAELNVALSVARGLTPSGIAMETGISVHTVRNQLKSVFAKTGTSRQSQLASLATRMGL